MLMQNFMAAEDLDLTDQEHAALAKVLGMLERGEMKHVSMTDWSTYVDAPCPACGGAPDCWFCGGSGVVESEPVSEADMDELDSIGAIRSAP